MAIKVGYIFLKTLSISLDIPLLACDGFAVNHNSPIPAFGKMYFIKNGEKIEVVHLENVEKSEVDLPTNIDDIEFTKDTEPLYILPAI